MSLSEVSLGRWRKPRQETTPGFARGAGWFFGFLAVLAAVGTVLLARSDASGHDDLSRFDAAPVCATSVPPGTSADCKSELTGTVESAAVSEGKDPMVTLRLRTSDGAQIVAVVNAIGVPEPGETADVTLWRGRCITVRAEGAETIPVRGGPAWDGNNQGIGVLMVLAFTVVLESVSAIYFTYFTVHPERMAAAYLLTAVPLLVTAMLRLSHLYDAVVVASIVTPLAVAGLYALWPRLEWAQRKTRWAGPTA